MKSSYSPSRRVRVHFLAAIHQCGLETTYDLSAGRTSRRCRLANDTLQTLLLMGLPRGGLVLGDGRSCLGGVRCYLV
jgi:hypothetical protein